MARNGVSYSGKPPDRSSRVYKEASERWRRKLARSGYVECYICKKEINLEAPFQDASSLTVDHVIPLSRGGSLLDESNWMPSHRGCNSAKKDRLDYEHVQVNASRSW